MTGSLPEGERERYRSGITAKLFGGGGYCTLLVIGTNRRVLLLHHGATDTAAELTGHEATELADCLSTAAQTAAQ
ncbi:MAG: hypothetical protein GEV09_02010 [Pseudonocardiaceae bacterium]|nr:hypothetical protein [Pseudonocardiaceae bacterium]